MRFNNVWFLRNVRRVFPKEFYEKVNRESVKIKFFLREKIHSETIWSTYAFR